MMRLLFRQLFRQTNSMLVIVSFLTHLLNKEAVGSRETASSLQWLVFAC